MRTAKRFGAYTALTLILSFFILCSQGCDTAPQPGGAEKRSADTPLLIGILIYSQEDPFLDIVAHAMQETLIGKAEVRMFHAKGDQTVQLEQVASLLAKGVDALAINIVDPLATGKVADVVQRAGVPMVFFNREPDLDNLRRYPKAAFVGTNIADAGIMQGDIVSELWEKHPEFDRDGDDVCAYVMIQASLDNPESMARTEYSIKQARARGVAMRQAGETLFCGWSADQAYEAMRLAFPLLENEVEMIIANNDAMALGAIRALNEFGYNLAGGSREKFLPVIGVDAIPPAVEAIRKGIMSATVKQDAKAMGAAVAALCLNAAMGKDFLHDTPYTWDASGFSLRIPYARFSLEE